MKKKGFTLIELLAVIVILAVIALIATPIILGVINKAEQNAFKNSVYGVYDAIDYYYTTNLDQTGLDKEFDFSKTVPLNYKGEKMLSGKITIDEKGNKIVSFVTNGEYCANGVNNDIKISDDCIKLDETASEIDKNKIRTIATTNSITVILGEGFAVDNESGIKDYEYIIKKDNKEISKYKTTDETYTFEGLSHNTEYEITIKVTNKNNKVNEVTIKVSTLKIEAPKITTEDVPKDLQNGYLKKQVATITYTKESVTSPTYYVKTTRAGTSSITVTKSCGTGITPGECTTITSTTSLAANTWYVVSGNVSVTYSSAATSTGTIYAAAGDGINLSVMSTGTIDKIDTTSPEVSLGTPTTSSNSITIPITSIDSESGLGTATCKYTTTNDNNYVTNASSVSTTSCSLTGLTKGTTYYYQVCIPDKVGNEATCKTGSATTGVPTKPTISYENTPDETQNGYLYKQEATITYTKGSVTSPTYYVKTSRAGTSSLSVTKSCGTGTNPGTCSTITSTTSLEANTWYVVSGNVSVTYSTESTTTGTIYAAVADSTGNLSETLAGTIDKIDRTLPTDVTIDVTGNTSTSVNLTLTANDAHSGISKYIVYYGTSKSTMTLTKTISTTKTSTSIWLTDLEAGSTYYFKVVAYDAVGNTTTSSTEDKTLCTMTTIRYYSTPSTTSSAPLLRSDYGYVTTSSSAVYTTYNTITGYTTYYTAKPTAYSQVYTSYRSSRFTKVTYTFSYQGGTWDSSTLTKTTKSNYSGATKTASAGANELMAENIVSTVKSSVDTYSLAGGNSWYEVYSFRTVIYTVKKPLSKLTYTTNSPYSSSPLYKLTSSFKSYNYFSTYKCTAVVTTGTTYYTTMVTSSDVDTSVAGRTYYTTQSACN